MQKKTNVKAFYGRTKGGVNVMDMISGTFTTQPILAKKNLPYL